MSANFHPKEDLVVSASLDQTVRVWDISGAYLSLFLVSGRRNSTRTLKGESAVLGTEMRHSSND
jgi:WD40 repeat protein